MIRTSLEFKADTNFGTRKTFETKFNKVVTGLGTQALQYIRPYVNNQLNAYPGPVKRPIQWTSDRQRRAFFATKGFGRGIPTQRSGKAIQWILAYKDGAIILYNPVEYAKFLWGGFGRVNYQQRFHRNTGYPLARQVRDKAFAMAIQYMSENFAETLDAFGVFTTEVKNR